MAGRSMAVRVQSQLIRVVWAACCAVPMFANVAVLAEDWPQWRGPQRDGRWNETDLLPTIPAAGLTTAWRMPVGGGYAGPAVAGGKVYVFDYDLASGTVENNPGGRNALQGQERLWCLSETDGKVLWKFAYDCPYSISYACGPRCTPTVDGSVVYILGSEGHLHCVNATDGTEVWQRVLKSSPEAESPIWGFASHPLVDRERLLVLEARPKGQGAVVCLNKFTGETMWDYAFPNEIGYAPVSLVEIEGVPQLLAWHAGAVVGLKRESGELLWEFPLKPDFAMSIAAPQVVGDQVFASAMKTTGAVFTVYTSKSGENWLTNSQWTGSKDVGVYCSNMTPLIQDGVVYGIDVEKGWLAAVRLSDGERLWTTYEPTTNDRRARHATAFIVSLGDRAVLFNESGDLIMAKLTPEKYVELGRTHLLEPTGEAFGRSVVWSHPAFANGHVFARNDKEVVCVSLRSQSP